MMWTIDGDFVDDCVQEEATNSTKYEEWDHEEDGQDRDDINLLGYEKLEYDYDEDGEDEIN